MSTATPVTAADTGLRDAHLEIVDPATDPKVIPLRFNPAEYRLKKSQTFAEIAIPGLAAPPVQWVRGGLATLSFDALLDTSHTLEDVDAAYVNRLRALLDPDAKLHAPPIVAFVWGRRRFTGVLDGIDIAYQLFDAAGVPLRAKAGITLKEYRPVAVQLRETRRSSPDVEKTYLVRRGDTLPGIAAAVYADPARWRELAVANGISDPRTLRPGLSLLVPRLR
ncbi:LysM peptidoglycan-binding domain-containing protein [Actinoplanes sp. NPDC023714]|uniref:CIS tube protein n=1 Tax=Actinoplanes sp. NPDC023714 TaxID=3154322 RepID=UPI0033F0809B